MYFASFLSTSLVIGTALTANAAVYTVPFFTGPQTTGNVYTDPNGGQWQAMSEEPFGAGLASLRAMQWSDPNSRWERTTAGLTPTPDSGTYASGPQITVLNAAAYPAITFIAPVAGTYSLDGTGTISGFRPRVYVSTFPSGGGTSTTLGGNFSQEGTISNVSYDFGAVTDYQNLSLSAGDRIHILIYRGAGETATLSTLNFGGADAVSIIGPAVPEPTALGMLAATGVLAGVRRRR